MPTKVYWSCHDNYERHITKCRCTGGQPKLVCDGRKFKHIMNSSEKVFYGEIHSSHGKDVDGLSASLSRSVDTSIMHRAAMEEKGAWSLTGKKSWPMDTI